MLPAPVRAARQDLFTTFLLRALAARAHALERKRPVRLAHDDFVAGLIDVLAAVLSAVPTPDARRSLRAATATRT